MSVDLCIELDQINWSEARKQLNISAGAVHLLRYIAWRQGDGVNGRVYLSQKQWLVHTGHSKSQFYEYLGELTSKGLVARLIKGSNINSTRANYKVNEYRLSQLPRIVLYTGQTNNLEVLNIEQGSPVLETTMSAIPEAKRHKQQQTTVSFQLSEARFKELVLDSLPFHLRQAITNGRDLDKELGRLLSAGYSDKQIKDKLNTEKQWQGIHTPYPHVRKFLATLWKENPVAIKSERVDYVDTPSEPTPMPADFKAQMNKLFKKPE